MHGSDDNQSAEIGDFIDATAAPGNKTLHIASLVYDKILDSSKGKGSKKKKNIKIFAFDRSSSRISILKDRVGNLAPSVTLDDDKAKANTNNNNFPVSICPRHEDFLKVDPNDDKYKNVTSILLDPSCSGSGIVNTPDRLADTTKQNETDDRIESLSNFQLVALKHAMSFPQCNKIVYSTCSVNQRENEDVVAAALQETNEQINDDEKKWELVSPNALRHWKRRGFKVKNLTQEQSQCLIRVDGMDGDDTNGFFVSYFERKSIRHNGEKKFTINVPSGIKAFYNREFSIQCDEEKEKSTATKKVTAHVKEEGMEIDDNKHNLHASKSNSQSEGGTTKKPLPRKAAKKMLWKQKQKELKQSRLQHKKK